MIVEPPAGRKSGKTKAFVWKIDQKFSKKTLGKGEKRQESLVVSGFLMDAMMYKNWDIYNFWKNHRGVNKHYRKSVKFTDTRKSKRRIQFADFSEFYRCTCTKQIA